jgi:hypothetical protein
MVEDRGVYRVLVWRPESKRPLVRPRHRWESNFKMELKDIGMEVANLIRLAQDDVQWRAFLRTVMSLKIP